MALVLNLAPSICWQFSSGLSRSWPGSPASGDRGLPALETCILSLESFSHPKKRKFFLSSSFKTVLELILVDFHIPEPTIMGMVWGVVNAQAWARELETVPLYLLL